MQCIDQGSAMLTSARLESFLASASFASLLANFLHHPPDTCCPPVPLLHVGHVLLFELDLC